MELYEKIRLALKNTEVILEPKELISSYGSTTVHYYMLAIPMYLQFEGKSKDSETIVREGRITWQKPKLLTPSYMLRLEGFSEEARKALEMLAMEDSDLAMLLYKLRLVRDSEKMDIVSESLNSVLDKIIGDINKKGDKHTAVIKGVDQFWDVSLSKFTQELMSRSAYYSQLPDMMEGNAIGMNSSGFPIVVRDGAGIPVPARKEIEILFKLFEKGEIKPSRLKNELDRWEVFDQYQDRFLGFFKRK
ncbi:MAG: hypothetical protein KAI62_05540 [Actinomycetia bacterium]|nr:hypothetical protein [Actinomycetes bacterium]